MHGRLKVKTTDQQEAEKKIKRLEKSTQFHQGMVSVLENRGIEGKDDFVLKESEKLLLTNPDVYTLWNIRKEIIETKLKENILEGDCEMLRKELVLTQNALHTNPKSYGVWNHRQFIIINMNKPNWSEELRLCNLFLKYDSRNFHCWDYRRFIVKESKVSFDDEIKFTTEKITENFSNYSAWHNRSNLYSSERKDGCIKKEILHKELELVRNAVFTDPNDQSAWFYHRWLLGRKKQEPYLLSLCVYWDDLPKLVATFSLPVPESYLSNAKIILNGFQLNDLNWIICNSNCSEHSYSMQWSAFGNKDLQGTLSVELNGCSVSLEIIQGQENSLCWLNNQFTNEHFLPRYAHTDVEVDVLRNELESCQILYDEEPNNKWTMLTLLHLMHAVDLNEYNNEMSSLLDKLVRVDSIRKGYYNDLRSKYEVERVLEQLFKKKMLVDCVDLSCRNLTCLPYAQYFSSFKKLNLCGNNGLNELTVNQRSLLSNVELIFE
ncbi:geranylgeranyl transferase type-2 subunit alpha-like isoform X1 [Hydra vulgaris]|uniref:Geranylgeranyl transferase type-2 subunit alpha n=1 Tax=Hydra vulgaris TaxID=6087 RepID=A0ABM4DKI2_HYDVU